MQNQLPLFLSYNQVRDLPIVAKYEKIFDELDLWNIPEFNFGVGANGTSQHALIHAFVIRSLESLNTVSALIRFLQANPAIIYFCGFQNQEPILQLSILPIPLQTTTPKEESFKF